MRIAIRIMRVVPALVMAVVAVLLLATGFACVNLTLRAEGAEAIPTRFDLFAKIGSKVDLSTGADVCVTEALDKCQQALRNPNILRPRP
jgi:hypothetical protein